MNDCVDDDWNCQPLDCQTIIDAASSAQSVTVDGQTVQERSLTDLIAVDKYLLNKRASKRCGGGWGSIRIAKAIPPGAQ